MGANGNDVLGDSVNLRHSAATFVVLATLLAGQTAQSAAAAPAAGYKERTTAWPSRMTLAQAPASVQAAWLRSLSRAWTHSPNDQYGWSVALSGSTAIVGAIGVRNWRGAVYIFARSGSTWHQQAKLMDPLGSTDDEFGHAVALSGSTAIVGSSGANGSYGLAYVYVRSGTSWQRQATLQANPAVTGANYFGWAVALSGPGKALIGGQGAAYVYVRSGATWHQQGKLADPAGNIGNDCFGCAVAISGSEIVLGAPGWNNSTGAAYVYVRSGSTWQRQEKVADPTRRANDNFGNSVAILSTTITIGAPGVHSNSGAAYIYVLSGATLHRQAKLAGPANSLFGTAASMSKAARGLRLLVGAPWDNASTCGGAAFDFALSAGTWREKAKVANPGCAIANEFGHSVALSGRSALIGAPYYKNWSGQSYFLTIP